jgi:hypothetical protein
VKGGGQNSSREQTQCGAGKELTTHLDTALLTLGKLTNMQDKGQELHVQVDPKALSMGREGHAFDQRFLAAAGSRYPRRRKKRAKWRQKAEGDIWLPRKND